ncbi:hypothetical protein H5410_013562 [Solanum commersonii]|uniref:protoporphyrinogen oxidase n=1 Tax=Solanum commersonii TaxID=4109 RepID=A0A9J5ZNS0_SOLCO|nr:hypothetical protein H5410_013562 [Solanum commersonii]
MDDSSSSSSVDPNSGFSSKTKTFHSLQPPPLLLPPMSSPLSAASYALSLQHNTEDTAFIDSSTGRHISFSDFRQRVVSLASSIQNTLRLSKNDVTFVLSPNSTHIPILYFSLLSLGVVISPANPLSTESELLRQIKLTKPVIAFATSRNFQKLPKLKRPTVLIDSPEFELMMTNTGLKLETVEVNQSDLAAIMYSSGTTGEVKGVKLTHRNFIASIANYHAQRRERDSPAVMLYTVPLFHVFGFHYILKSVALTETVVVMERFDLKKMLKTVEDFRVTQLVVAPPVVVAMAKGSVTHGYDLSSLEAVGSGGASLGKDVMQAFADKFPKIILFQFLAKLRNCFFSNMELNLSLEFEGYGLTETAGAAFRAATTEEMLRQGSVGRLLANSEAKIVDPDTGIALPPAEQGELWIKGPTIMQGYIGDPKNTSETLMPGGWLRTGDLCYIDHHGYLFVVDRLKELIKYKGYQVAPAELEQLLQSHPEIVDAAVIPYPDEEAGQLPMAFVVRRPQSALDKEQVIDFISKQIVPRELQSLVPASAYKLKIHGLNVTVFEAEGRAGGKLRSLSQDGLIWDEGANTMTESEGDVTFLLDSLGLRERQQFPLSQNKRYIARNGTPTLIPSNPIDLIKSNFLSTGSKLQMLFEPLLWKNNKLTKVSDEHESVSGFFQRHFGKEVVDYLIDPFVSGTCGGDPDSLSMHLSFPELWNLEKRYVRPNFRHHMGLQSFSLLPCPTVAEVLLFGSVIVGAIRSKLSPIKEKKQGPPKTSVNKKRQRGSFSFLGGMQTLTDAICKDLKEDELRLNSRVLELSCSYSGDSAIDSWSIFSASPHKRQAEEESFDAVIMTAPLCDVKSMKIAKRGNPFLLNFIPEVDYVPLSVVITTFKKESVKHPLEGFGVLVPSQEQKHGLKTLGTLFSSMMFPDRAPNNVYLYTTFVGGSRNRELAKASRTELKEIVTSDLKQLLGAEGEPTYVNHVCWSKAFPLYGHNYDSVLDAIDKMEKDLPGLFYAGNHKGGLSVGKALSSGCNAADLVISYLEAVSTDTKNHS